MTHEDPDYIKKSREKKKERDRRYRAKYPDRPSEYYAMTREKQKAQTKEYNRDRYNNAVDSIRSGHVIDDVKWGKWCDEIKRRAMNNKHSYSEDFTNDVMFDMMVKGCFYCGDIATTIDRIDSKLEHTLDNCVGCCKGCNKSKSAADLSTFIRKAYYRVNGKYYDGDADIWFVNKNKPRAAEYKYRAKKQGVPFDLSKEDFDILINSNCEYCKRSPTTWFGIDKRIPSLGYVLGNVVSCCWDCNNDKSEDDVETMRVRNEKIVNRVNAGDLLIIDCDKVILHNGS